MATDVVQVELIGSGYDWILPTFALVVSVGTLIWTRIDRYRDGAKLKVRATSFSYQDEFGRTLHQVAVVVTNTGRQGATVVDTVKFQAGAKGGHLLAWPMQKYSAPLPKKLEPGESANFVFERIPLCQIMVTSGVKPEDFLAIAVTGHGETRGKFDEAALSFIAPEVKNKKPQSHEERP